MKIGILTLPLHTNYGGNLQAYALMTTLKCLGHEVWLINRDRNHNPWYRYPASIAKRLILKHVFRKPVPLDKREKKIYESHIKQFLCEKIQPQTISMGTSFLLKRNIRKYKFDAIIVGSDQIWRPKYTPKIEDNFLSFLSHDEKIIRIAYAASFGLDNWTFSEKQTDNCKFLAQLFDSISVREKTGINLCQEYLKVEACVTLDPTLLLDSHKYHQLLKDKCLSPQKGGIFSYLLDKDEDKIKALKILTNKTNMPVRELDGPFKKFSTAQIEPAPSTEEWINGIRNADFVFTDSFHGCVFSLIFNRPFIAYGNATRGLTRFTSLLETFDLKNRVIYFSQDIYKVLEGDNIDWQRVNEILNIEREKSLSFIRSSLAH